MTTCNPNYKPLLKLIFENCNQDKNSKYKIYQNDENIDHICLKLSCVSKFIERLVKITTSSLTDEQQIQQIQRFKDHTHKPIFNDGNASKLLKLMTLFINPNGIKKKKAHSKCLKENPVYNNCYNTLNTSAIKSSFQEPTLNQEERDYYIGKFYDVLSKDELEVLKTVADERSNASKYPSLVSSPLQSGGALGDEDKISVDKVKKANAAFFKELFHRISSKIQEDKTYGTLDSVVDYKKRLEVFVRESVQEMDVPDNLKYFVDNVTNLVDAIYPSNLLDFVKSDNSLAGKVANEFSEPFELVELVLFALSVIPIPVVNLIPDFMLIVHNMMNGKRIMFTILSSIALIIKIMSMLFFDFGPLLKMFYLSKKIKNFNISDLSQVMDSTVNDILTMPGGISKFGTGMLSKAMLPLASAGQLRPENMSIQLGNNAPITGAKPITALSQLRNSGMGKGASTLSGILGNLKQQKDLQKRIAAPAQLKEQLLKIDSDLVKQKARVTVEQNNFNTENAKSTKDMFKFGRIKGNLENAEKQVMNLEARRRSITAQLASIGESTGDQLQENKNVRKLAELKTKINIRECKLLPKIKRETKSNCRDIKRLDQTPAATERLQKELAQFKAEKAALEQQTGLTAPAGAATGANVAN
jgi:hypothetical protein